MNNPFEPSPITEHGKNEIMKVQANFKAFTDFLFSLMPDDCREKSLCITKLEEACLFAIKGIAKQKDPEQKESNEGNSSN